LPIPGNSPTIPIERLDAYCGRYRGDPAPLLVVARTGARLVATSLDDHTFFLYPESEDRFLNPTCGARFRFEADSSGRFVNLVVSQDSRTFEAHRLP
jgi:hypothetical protein